MILISVYECVVFYATGFWKNSGTFIEWFGFIALILILYFISIAIYLAYSRKQGKSYTLALQKYQEKRSAKHE